MPLFKRAASSGGPHIDRPQRSSRAEGPARAKTSFRIREADEHDAEALLSLFAQLGKPTTTAALRARLSHGGVDDRSVLWVAVAEDDGRALGMCGAVLIRPLTEDAPIAQLLFMLTDSGARGNGVGSALSTHFEGWARSRGAVSVLVVAGTHGDGHHRGYDTYGYARVGSVHSKEFV